MGRIKLNICIITKVLNAACTVFISSLLFFTIGCVEIVVIAVEAMVEEMPIAPPAVSLNSDIWWIEYLLLFKGRPIKRVSINVL